MVVRLVLISKSWHPRLLANRQKFLTLACLSGVPTKTMASGSESSPGGGRLFRWAVVGVIVAGVSYLALRRYRLAYCEDKGCNNARDPVDLVLEDVKAKLDDLSADWWQRAKDSLFDERMKEALDFITDILENLKAFDAPDLEYTAPRFILLALVKKAQEVRDQKEDGSSSLAFKMHKAQFEEAKRMGQFALNVYDASWIADKAGVAKKMDLDGEQYVIFTWFEDRVGDDDHCPKFMIFVDDQTKSVVLAIRGTYSFADVITDIVCDEEVFLGGFAHRGIHRGAKKIMREGGQHLMEALEQRPDYKLVVTGHSLGAGTAILICMDILAGNFKEAVPKQTHVQCIALAPPPVYRTDKKIDDRYTDNIHIYINNNDCVPRLSLANMAKLMAMMRAVDSLEMSPLQHLQMLAGVKEPEVEANMNKVLEAIDEAQQDRFPFLDHPGKIFYLRKRDDQQSKETHFSLYNKQSDFFSRKLLLFENMILDHLQPYYEEAFAKVVQDQLD